ncbi:DUF6515 family protein [Yeosuana marina]|uniref:DUF6515 family protein n=1 Tax=Yeosuana marina TaxID=1565536 RepID=UPI001421D554|nr:DUF6515 family protein [Yeosuana marina]
MRTLLILLSAICMISVSSCATRVVTRPETVTVIKTRPANYKIVKVRGKRYYFWNGNHYRKTRRGYVIVKP